MNQEQFKIEVSADFSKAKQQFEMFNKEIGTFANFTGIQASLSEVTQSFAHLTEMMNNFDKQISTKKGLADYNKQLNDFIKKMQDVSKESSNLLKSMGDKNTSMMPVELLSQYVKKRDIADAMKGIPRKEMNDLKKSVQNDGFAKALSLGFDPNKGTAQLMDGHLALGIAQKLGLTHVPTTIIRQSLDKGYAVPDAPDFSNLKRMPSTFSAGSVFGLNSESISQEMITSLTGIIKEFKNNFKSNLEKQTAPTKSETKIDNGNELIQLLEQAKVEAQKNEQAIVDKQKKIAEDYKKKQIQVTEEIASQQVSSEEKVAKTREKIEDEVEKVKQKKPRQTDKGILSKTPEQLQKELALLSLENGMVKSLVNGFKDLTNIIVEKNKLLKEELGLLKLEQSTLDKILANADKVESKKEPVVGLAPQQSHQTTVPANNHEDLQPFEFTPEEMLPLDNNDEEEQNTNSRLDKKIKDINNFLATVDNKLLAMRKNYGTYLDTNLIATNIKGFRDSITESRDNDPENFRRSDYMPRFNYMINDIKTHASNEGITNPTSMMNRVISLYEKEYKLKEDMSKLDASAVPSKQKELNLVEQERAQIEKLLTDYRLLTDVQNNHLANEKKKIELSNQSRQDNANATTSTTNGQNSKDKMNIKQNLTEPVTDFFNVFNTQGTGAISTLHTMNNSIMNLRYSFEGFIAMLGGQKLYNWLIGTNAQIEVLQQSMEVTMHNAEQAAQTIQNLRSYAALTPFQENETFKAGEMLASNKMDVMGWIRTAGDLASAKATQGVQLEDVVNVLTRINSGDFGKAMIRLRQMGISLADLRSQGLQFSKNNEFKGTTEQMLDAVQRIVEQRYGGMTEALSQTLNGRMSTIKDYFLQLGIDVGQEAFDGLKNFLTKFQNDLHKFRNSLDFKQLIVDFNEALRQTEDALGVILPIIKTVVMTLLKNLPEIVTYFKVMFVVKSAQAFLGMINTIKSNQAMVNEQVALQLKLINDSRQAEGKEEIVLTEIETRLAKINALRELGLKLATDTTAAEAVARNLAMGKKFDEMTGSYTSAGKIANEKVTQKKNDLGGAVATAELTKELSKTQAAGKALTAGGAAAGMMGKLAGIGALLSGFTAILPLLIMFGSGISSMFKEREGTYTKDDYTRRANEQIEEYDRLKELNVTRKYARGQREYYESQSKITQANVNQTKSVSDANPNDVAAKDAYNRALSQNARVQQGLNDAISQGNSAVQKMITLDPKLSNVLVDQNGNLSDNTQSFKKNTDEIEKNLTARAKLINSEKEKELLTAQAESSKAKKEIDKNNLYLKDTQKTGIGWKALGIVGGASTAFIQGLLTPFGLDSKLNGSKKFYDIISGSDEDKQMYKNELQAKNLDLGNQINEAKKLQNDWKTAEKQGYYKRDSSGNIVLDNNGNKVLDWSRWQRDQKALQAKQQGDLTDEEQIAQRAQDISETGGNRAQDIHDSYQVKLNNIKRKNGGRTDSKEYKDLEKQRDAEIEKAYKSVIDDIDAMADKNKQSQNDELARILQGKLGQLSDILQDPEIQPADILEAFNTLQAGVNTHLQGKLAQYEGLLRAFINDPNNDITSFTADLNLLQNLDNNKKAIEREKNKALLEQQKLEEDKKEKLRTEYQELNDEWSNKLSMSEDQKDINLQQSQLKGDFQGSASYKQIQKDSDKATIETINGYIAALQNTLPNLTDKKDIWDAKSKIVQLQKQANELTLELEDKANKDSVGFFHETWDPKLQQSELEQQIALQKDELANYTQDSVKYTQDNKKLLQGRYDQMQQAIKAFTDLIPKLDTKTQITAQVELLQMQAQANDLLLQIKKNTDKFGEFNKPSFVKTMTYYDYMTQQGGTKGIEIGNANFAFKIDAPQTQEDVEEMMRLIQSSLGIHLGNTDRNGVTNPYTRT